MPIKVLLGINPDVEQSVTWCPGKENNGILLVTGASGSGKTEALKLLGSSIAYHGIPVVSIDFHGDMVVDGQTDIVLSAGPNGQAGINPLAVDPYTLAHLGLSAKIEREVERITAVSSQASYKQKSCLQALLREVYRLRGIQEDSPWTWSNPPPTLMDLAVLLSEACQNGMEGYEKSTLQSCHAKLSLLAGNRVFSHPNWVTVPGMKALNCRFNCHALTREAQVLVAETLLEMIFEAERAQGPIPVHPKSDAERFRVFIMVDEAKLLTLARNDANRPDHILNILATEGRKYGIGLILASQVASHFGHEAHANAGSRLVLTGLDDQESRIVSKVIGVPAGVLQIKERPGAGYVRSMSTGGTVRVFMRRPI